MHFTCTASLPCKLENAYIIINHHIQNLKQQMDMYKKSLESDLLEGGQKKVVRNYAENLYVDKVKSSYFKKTNL